MLKAVMADHPCHHQLHNDLHGWATRTSNITVARHRAKHQTLIRFVMRISTVLPMKYSAALVEEVVADEVDTREIIPTMTVHRVTTEAVVEAVVVDEAEVAEETVEDTRATGPHSTQTIIAEESWLQRSS